MNDLSAIGLRACKSISFTGGTAAACSDAVNTWIVANALQKKLLQLQFVYNGTTFAAFLLYTE